MNQHSSNFCGASGADYSYYVFPLNFVPKDNQFYNYMFASLSSEGDWNPVFIGQGDLKEYVTDPAHIRSVKLKGATNLLAHMSPHAQQRRAEELDMLGGHPQAYEPTGCNRNTLVNAALLRMPNKEKHVPPTGKSWGDAFSNDGTFAERTGPHDSVWARLRAKD